VSKNINNTPRRIKFWANREQSHYIKTKPIHRSQQVISENHEDGSCIFQIEVVINFEMYSVFMSYGSGIKIIYPRNAMMYMRDKFKEALKLYEVNNENGDITK
jgi:predicted DNA-binding transcriptional regulator YafY